MMYYLMIFIVGYVVVCGPATVFCFMANEWVWFVGATLITLGVWLGLALVTIVGAIVVTIAERTFL